VLTVAEDPAELLGAFAGFVPPRAGKWLELDQT
jgi:hypothetical protein